VYSNPPAPPPPPESCPPPPPPAISIISKLVNGLTAEGVILLLSELAAEDPLAFIEVTVKVYDVPFVNPVNVYGDDVAVCVVVAGLETIEYPVIVEPPVAPGVIVKDASAFPYAALTLGACGTVVAVTADDADEALDVPKVFAAVTV
jgi:hypothetical protein